MSLVSTYPKIHDITQLAQKPRVIAFEWLQSAAHLEHVKRHCIETLDYLRNRLLATDSTAHGMRWQKPATPSSGIEYAF